MYSTQSTEANQQHTEPRACPQDRKRAMATNESALSAGSSCDGFGIKALAPMAFGSSAQGGPLTVVRETNGPSALAGPFLDTTDTVHLIWEHDRDHFYKTTSDVP